MRVELPVLESGIPVVDRAFRIACGDFVGNIGLYRGGALPEPRPVLLAGAGYPSPWTRDASFNTWYAGFIAPEAAKNALLSVVDGRGDDARVGEACGQYWDRIIWAVGAWHYYLYTGDDGFVAPALRVIENTLDDCRRDEWDDNDGLYRGGACFQDGIAGYPDAFISRHRHSGILDFVKDPPEGAHFASRGGGLPMKALSTNCLYWAAMRVADRFRRIIGMPARHGRERRALRRAINARFRHPDTGAYRYLLDAFDADPRRQEGLGHAFALLSGLAGGRNNRARLVNATHRTAHGLPCVWPRYERYPARPGVYPRHSGVIWPQVNAAWCSALADAGFRGEALFELERLAEKAARFGMFHEIYHPESGCPYGGVQENGAAGVVDWKSQPRQTWAAAGFIHMVVKALFGLKFGERGMTCAPALPDGVDRLRLLGFNYRGALLNITVRRGGDKTPADGRRPAGLISPRLGTTVDVTIPAE